MFTQRSSTAAPRVGFVERADYERLFAVLPDYLRPALALGFWTGMRRAEILGLQWRQVDFIAGWITLRAGDGRTIPIATPLRSLLLEQRKKSQPGCDYVCFRLDRRGVARKIGNFRKIWQSRCVKLGLGKMEPAGEVLTAVRRDRPHAKPKPKMVYRGMLFTAYAGAPLEILFAARCLKKSPWPSAATRRAQSLTDTTS